MITFFIISDLLIFMLGVYAGRRMKRWEEKALLLDIIDNQEKEILEYNKVTPFA